MKTNKQSAKKKRSSQRFNCFSAKKRTTMKTDQSSCYCLADPDHFRAKKSDWEEIFQIPGMTNITLMGNDSLQTIETCKILLASLGTKFEALLGQPTIHLNYPFSTVQVLHEFSLSGECNCDETNFEPLLKLAKKFNIKGIQLFGGLFLRSQVNAENAARMYQLSKELLCCHDQNQIQKFILANFEDLGQNESFLTSCTAKMMEEFIQHDELDASEENIFSILLSWARISPENMREFQQTVVKHVRFSFMRPAFFDTVVKPCDVLQNSPVLKHASEIVKSKNINHGRSLRYRNENFRLPNSVVFSIGGFDTKPLNVIEVFDIRARKWSTLKQSFPTHAYHEVQVVGTNKIFVFGGYGDAGRITLVYYFLI
jgi:hypothetical protein